MRMNGHTTTSQQTDRPQIGLDRNESQRREGESSFLGEPAPLIFLCHAIVGLFCVLWEESEHPNTHAKTERRSARGGGGTTRTGKKTSNGVRKGRKRRFPLFVSPMGWDGMDESFTVQVATHKHTHTKIHTCTTSKGQNSERVPWHGMAWFSRLSVHLSPPLSLSFKSYLAVVAIRNTRDKRPVEFGLSGRVEQEKKAPVRKIAGPHKRTRVQDQD